MATFFAIAMALLALLLAFLLRRAQYHRQDLDDRIWQLEEESRSVFELLRRMGENVSNEAISLDSSLEHINNKLVALTESSAGAIFLLDENSQLLEPQAVCGVFPPLHHASEYVMTKTRHMHEAVKQDRLPVGEGLIGTVAKTGQPLLIADATQDERIPSRVQDLAPIQNMILCPLKLHDSVLGVICMINRRGEESYRETDLRLLEVFSSQASAMLGIVKMYTEMSRRHKIEQELALAQRFQQMLLPKSLPQIPGLEISGVSKPAQEIGGDFYDCFWLGDAKLAIVMADVVGKGIPGALIMSMTRSVIRAHSGPNRTPIDIIRDVNRRLMEDTEEKVFVTMTFAVLDLNDLTLTHCRAGQEPLITISGEQREMRVRTPSGIALGLVDPIPDGLLELERMDVANQDVLFFYTDGVVEAMNRKSEEFGQQRLLDSLHRHESESATQIRDGLLAELRKFRGDAEQHDDITMTVLKILDAEKVQAFSQTRLIRKAEAR